METTSLKKLWRANENVLTSAKQYQERLSGPGILGASNVSSKAQALERQAMLGQCLATENVEQVKFCYSPTDKSLQWNLLDIQITWLLSIRLPPK